MQYLRRRISGRSPTQQSPSPPVTPTNEDLEPSLQGQDDPVLEREFVPIQFLTNRIRTLSQISVPHDLNRLEQHKRNMKEHYGKENWIKLHAEQLNASRTVQQLKGHLETLDELRRQVNPDELVTFDNQTYSLRKDILVAVQDYQLITADMRIEDVGGATLEEPEAEGQRLLTQQHGDHYQSLEELRSDLLELNGLVERFNAAVNDHSEQVAALNRKTSNTSASIQGGVSNLSRVQKLKSYVLPVGGAIAGGVLGGVVGGPVGAVAGLKIGAVTAVTVGTAGAVGGALIGYRANAKVVNSEKTEAEEKKEAIHKKSN